MPATAMVMPTYVVAATNQPAAFTPQNQNSRFRKGKLQPCTFSDEICHFRRIVVGVNGKDLRSKFDLLQCKCPCLIVQTLHPRCRWQQLQVSHCWPLHLYLPSLHCRIHIKVTCHIRHSINMWVLFISSLRSGQYQRFVLWPSGTRNKCLVWCGAA